MRLARFGVGALLLLLPFNALGVFTDDSAVAGADASAEAQAESLRQRARAMLGQAAEAEHESMLASMTLSELHELFTDLATAEKEANTDPPESKALKDAQAKIKTKSKKEKSKSKGKVRTEADDNVSLKAIRIAGMLEKRQCPHNKQWSRMERCYCITKIWCSSGQTCKMTGGKKRCEPESDEQKLLRDDEELEENIKMARKMSGSQKKDFAKTLIEKQKLLKASEEHMSEEKKQQWVEYINKIPKAIQGEDADDKHLVKPASLDTFKLVSRYGKVGQTAEERKAFKQKHKEKAKKQKKGDEEE